MKGLFIHRLVMHRVLPPLVQWAQPRLSTDLIHIPFVALFTVKSLPTPYMQLSYMWISGAAVATMAPVFASPAFNLGDIRVSGTLAAVRGAFAR